MGGQALEYLVAAGASLTPTVAARVYDTWVQAWVKATFDGDGGGDQQQAPRLSGTGFTAPTVAPR